MKRLRPIPKKLLWTFIIVAVLGFADATFLTIEHYSNVIPPCTTDGCETVLTSSYATVAGIPVALLGSIYYLAILILLISHLDTTKEKFLRLATFLTSIGLISSIYLFILQAFVIHAFCQYCLVSAAVSVTLFIISGVIWKRYHETV